MLVGISQTIGIAVKTVNRYPGASFQMGDMLVGVKLSAHSRFHAVTHHVSHQEIFKSKHERQFEGLICWEIGSANVADSSSPLEYPTERGIAVCALIQVFQYVPVKT